MLKLKKASGPEAIALTFATQDKIFNKDFCVALGIAAGLHLLGLIIFTVHMGIYSGSNTVLSPVTVLTEPLELEKNSSIIADVFSNPISKRQIPPPPKMVHEQTSSAQNFFLGEVEVTPFKNRLPDWPTVQTSIPALTITPSGSLAGRLLKAEPKLPKIKTFGDYEVIHQVRVDERSGEIFWFKLQKSSGKSAIDQLAEKLLKNTQFETAGKNGISSGTMEWKFHLEDTND